MTAQQLSMRDFICNLSYSLDAFSTIKLLIKHKICYIILIYNYLNKI